VGFEPTIPVFKRAKTFHALDHAATVIGDFGIIEAISDTSLKRPRITTKKSNSYYPIFETGTPEYKSTAITLH
jgi:hypothetical protein